MESLFRGVKIVRDTTTIFITCHAPTASVVGPTASVTTVPKDIHEHKF